MTSWQIDGKKWNQWQILFSWAPKWLQWWLQHKIKRRLLLGRKAMINLDDILKSRDIALLTKVCIVKAMVFHVKIWELDHKEGQEPKKWCFQTVMLEKAHESPLDSQEIKLVNPKGNQSWIFTGRTDTEAEAPILWPPNVKSQLIGKDPDAGKDWGQKGATREEMFVCHHRLSGHESEQTLGDTEGPEP